MIPWFKLIEARVLRNSLIKSWENKHPDVRRLFPCVKEFFKKEYSRQRIEELFDEKINDNKR